MKDFNLSEKIMSDNYPSVISEQDVKEFISLVKEAVGHQHPNKKQINYVINKLAGEELSQNSLKGCGKVSAGDEVCGEDYICHECNNRYKSEVNE